MSEFEFPPLGATGEGEIVYPPGTSAADFRPGDRPTYWYGKGCVASGKPLGTYRPYYVVYQLDRPACAFRCYYPGGAAPCDQATADRFIEWASRQP